MGYQDVVNSVRRTFSPQVITTLAKDDPLLRKLIESQAVVQQKGGSSRELLSVWRAGVAGKEITDDGLTAMDRQSVDVTKVQKVSPVALGFDLVLPETVMDKMQGDGMIKDYAQKRIQTAYTGGFQDIMSHFLTGFSDGKVFPAGEMKNLLTLNGEHNTGSKEGCLHGLLDFDTVANQTSSAQVVQNLAKSSTYEHYNQYEVASDWATDGRSSMRKAWRAARRRDHLYSKGPDMAWASDDTYDNILADNFANVRVKEVKENGDGFDDGVLMMQFGNMMLSASEYIDVDDYTAAKPKGGLVIMLNSRYLELWTLLSKVLDSKPFNADISGAQRALVSRFTFHGNFALGNLPAHAMTTFTDA